MVAKGVEFIFMLICTRVICESHPMCLAVGAKQISMGCLDCIKGSPLFSGGYFGLFRKWPLGGLETTVSSLRCCPTKVNSSAFQRKLAAGMHQHEMHQRF